MLSKTLLLTSLFCSPLLTISHNADAATYDGPPHASPSDNDSGDIKNSTGGSIGSIDQDGNVSNSTGGSIGSINQDGDIKNSTGGSIGHAPNRAIGALMLLNVVPLQ